ncbi:MAG: amino acid permease [candidate division KSB1 bacterium]|nr:amino acid permease [candidate division KSB1 bacterium]MDZ7364424.1 amino acid permease [candidate division KSB1 bacterium]MDZ7402796.1 amino acid permease [candidate division KSB1 bacterium]
METLQTRNAEPHPSSPELLRAIGLKEAVAINIGCVIGSGIFLVPATIAGHLHAMGPIMLVWIVAGLLTFFGALSFAEMSSFLPKSGGPYVYLRESYGKIWGFLFSWNDFFINKAASLAAVSIAFTIYLGYLVPAIGQSPPFFKPGWTVFGHPFEFGWSQVIAISGIALVTLINVRGVQFGAWVMNIFTSAKVGALLFLILAAFVSSKASFANLQPWWPETWSSELTAAFGLAMISALWSYDGWIDVTLTAGETKNPTRNVPLALIISTLAILAIYLLANLAYTLIIPLHEMSSSNRIAADVALKAIGPIGATIIVAGIMCSTFGTLNGMALAGPRSIWAPGHDRIFAPALGKVHSRFRSPHVAIITIGIWAALLTLSGTYDQLTAYVVFGSWFFYAMTAVGVIVLRKKMPDVPRPYKAWGYPYVTLLFTAIAAWFVYNTLVEDTRDALIGIGLLILGLPFYYYWTRGVKN